MTITLSKRRLFAGLVVCLLGVAGVLWLARQALMGFAVNGLLNLAGATDVSFTVSAATPWRVEVDDLHFKVNGQPFAAKRISADREHWWTPSLGRVRVEGANVPIDLEHPLPKPRSAPPPPSAPAAPAKLPLQDLSIDGQVVLLMGGSAAQPVTVTIEAKVTGNDSLSALMRTDAPGLAIRGEGTFNVSTKALNFAAKSIAVDLKTWQPLAQSWLELPMADWTVDGKLTGTADGHWADGKLVGSARVQLREAKVENAVKGVTALGIEADLEITDLARFATKPASLRAQSVQAGKMQLRDLQFLFHFENMDEVAVAKATLATLGGTVSAEPFRYRFSREEIDAVVLVEGINVEDIMALTPDLPAKATGRVNGRFPLHLGAGGLRLGTGWMQLKPGAYAEIQFNADGLLTGGAAPNSPSYAVLKKVESGLLKLKVSELRLDIRPPNAPEGRSAQLHVAGEPVDPQVKAPVVLDLNVNGPLEKLINFGLDSRLSFGSKP